ncbi:GNAT family protein [Paenibacillus sp.]|jgi:RimJ/RimL family protein N-acetyltransferase|uniref:GNAT family N-acetyltransferase n=1 Tax=Paenibacillus sp. TaxID=58172 RepID=UPI002829648D|nr:GNAT family protein [Paenibacillus sp.]MDR0267985.1 GNAT family N-acetyltransferase [Paenibacillus sp.]
MVQMEGIQIEGAAIILRMAKESDLEAYYLFLQDAEFTKLTGSNQEFTHQEIADWLQKISVPHPDRVDFMIISKETNELLGEVVLNEIDATNRSANIRIGIQGSSNRGKGHGTEAMILMLRHGFETLKLHRIHLGVYPFNPRAIHVYKKIGFQQEGIQRDTLYQDEKFHDMIEMSLLEDEFRALHGKN